MKLNSRFKRVPQGREMRSVVYMGEPDCLAKVLFYKFVFFSYKIKIGKVRLVQRESKFMGYIITRIIFLDNFLG